MTPRVVRTVERKYELIPTPRPIRVCAYVRVSTGSIEQQNSLQNQTEYYEGRFAGHPQYVFIGIFSDSGISGAKDNRPGFQAMLKKARAGEIDFIYTKSISRFARNTLTLLKAVRELRELGVGIIFEEQGINTLHQDVELMLTILSSIAEEERKIVQTNILWSIRSRYARGDPLLNTDRILGYDKNDQGELVINEAQAAIVRRIFQLYLDGNTPFQIAKILSAQEVPTDTPSPWSDQRILRLIKNEKYKGDCLMQKSLVDGRGIQVKNRGQREKYYHEGAHPPIVSASDWEKARRIWESRAKKTYPFTSLLICCYCGFFLYRVIGYAGRIFWICCTYLHKGKATCQGARIPEQKLIAMTRNQPMTSPMIVEEIFYEEGSSTKPQKDYRLLPIQGYSVPCRYEKR